ncbi:WD40 repeat [Raineyella antarctica]|uniref:WD40 repeat n=1 Tax=Raineyella antarctica TaxID=1577474 RepID=A0A1G6GCW9_9ACTN|nr:hypothetical protein [Raineyella antarctica]SDB79837.1 WD40 repeat [Raineyella antarctica]
MPAHVGVSGAVGGMEPGETSGALPRTKRGIGEALAAARSRVGLSFRELGRRSSVPPGTLQGWIGGRSLPTPALRTAFFDVLDLLGLSTEHGHDDWWLAVEDARRAPGTPMGNPYVGLRAYAAEDHDLFFGRDRELAELAERVRQAQAHSGTDAVVALLGPSGAGKSSLLGAGLVGRALAPGGPLDGWFGTAITPGEDPATRIRAALAARALQADRPSAVLVIDQFEEVWTLASPEQRREALALLAEAVEPGSGPDGTAACCALVIGMRSDFFGQAAETELLGPALGHAMLLRGVGPEQALEIITGPSALRGVTVDPGLVALLWRELEIGGEGPAGGSLPLLSQALTETWDQAEQRTLTIRDYRAVGGVAGAIERAAERAYQQLSGPEQDMARDLLLALVRIDLDRPVRRPLELDVLQSDEAWSVVERFTQARLLTVTEDRVGLAHEALLEGWPRLGAWVADNVERLRAREYLARAAALWVENGRVDDLLVPVERFGLDRRSSDDRESLLSSEQRDFVAASRTHFAARELELVRTARTLRRRSRVAIGAFAVATVLAIVAGVSLVVMNHTRAQALSRQAALSSSLVAAQDPGLAAQIALGASELASTQEGNSALISTTGRALPRRALGPSEASKLAVSADADLLVQPGPDGALRLWRGRAADGAADGTPEILTLDAGHRNLFAGAVTSAGGRTLVAAGGMGGTWLVDAGTMPARVIADLGTGAGTTYALAFSPDGRTLYAGVQDGSVRRWDLTTPGSPRELAALSTQKDPVLALAIAPSGTRLAAAGAKGVSRWALDGAHPSVLPALATTAAAQAVAFSPDGQWLVAGETRSHQVSRWRLQGDTAASQPPLTGFGSFINDVHFSPDGTRVVVASSDQTMREFAQSSGTEIRSYPHPAVVSAAVYAGDHVVSAASDGTVRWWPQADPAFVHSATGLYQVSADATGTRLLATVDRNGSISAWDLADPAHPRRLPDPTPPALPAGEAYGVVTAVVGDGSAVLGGTRTGDLLVWDRRGDAFAPARVIPLDPGQDISWLGSSADGRTILASAYTSKKAFVLRRDGDAYAVTATIDVDQPQSMALSPDGRVVVIADIDARAGVWTLDERGQVAGSSPLFALGSTGTAAVLNPAGTSAAIGTDDGRVLLYDLSRPAEPRQVAAQDTALGAIYGMSVSTDGRYLAAGAGDKRIWVWQWQSDALVPFARVDAALDRVNDVRFVDGGRRLVGVGANGTGASWDIDLARARQTVCEGRGAPLSAAEWAARLVGARPRNLC